MFKNHLRLLAQLVESGGKLVDAAGIPVSPRTKLEIQVLPLALQLRKQMLESGKWFPQARKQYRELRKQLEVYCSEVFLSDFLDTVLAKLKTGEYEIELPQEELKNVRDKRI